MRRSSSNPDYGAPPPPAGAPPAAGGLGDSGAAQSGECSAVLAAAQPNVSVLLHRSPMDADSVQGRSFGQIYGLDLVEPGDPPPRVAVLACGLASHEVRIERRRFGDP